MTGVGLSGPNNPTGTEGSVAEAYVAPPQGNVISNKNDGVLITAGSKKNILQGNFIGRTRPVLPPFQTRATACVLNSDGTLSSGAAPSPTTRSFTTT